MIERTNAGFFCLHILPKQGVDFNACCVIYLLVQENFVQHP